MLPFQSSDSHVASSDTSGLVTANYIGTTYITISSITNPSVSKTIRVNITDDFTPPEGFDVRDSSVAKAISYLITFMHRVRWKKL